MIKLSDVNKTYILGEDVVKAVDNVSIEIKKGEYISILGTSGSGKSTLMHIIGLLDRPTTGTILINKKDISKLKDDELSQLRNTFVGFVFQQFNLINKLTLVENVALPAIYFKGTLSFDPYKKAKELLEKFGMGDRLNFYPNKISGGQQQRTAIARSLIMDPDLILADEPTGNLDANTGRKVFDLMEGLVKEKGVSLVFATHNEELAKSADRIFHLIEGRLENL